MTDYSMKQYAYAGQDKCLSAYPQENNDASGKLVPMNILGSEDATGDFSSYGRSPYQQIILNKMYLDKNSRSYSVQNPSFEVGTVYYLKLTLPRNSNYDLDFALLLIPEFGEVNDLDQLEYQFIKYIHVPKSDLKGLGQSTVVLYEEPKISKDNKKFYFDGTDIKVAIAEYLYKEDKKTYKDFTDADVGKLFYGNESPIVYYTIRKNGSDYEPVRAGKNYGSNNEKFVPIGKTTSIMAHSWLTTDTQDTCTYEIIFKPRKLASDTEPFKYLYLYLIPNSWDNDIMWLDEQNNGNGSNFAQYYGRHVDLKNIDCELFKINNLLDDGIIPRRLGIWGRSELMFTINGEEIKVGPSGYYELQNFDVNYLGVVARDHRDQFTIDVQYPIN